MKKREKVNDNLVTKETRIIMKDVMLTIFKRRVDHLTMMSQQFIFGPQNLRAENVRCLANKTSQDGTNIFRTPGLMNSSYEMLSLPETPTKLRAIYAQS